MMQATSVQPPKTVRIIPATIDTKAAITQSYRQLRVAAYCRVSTKQDEQLNSYEVQRTHYEERIRTEPKWSLVGIFADKGITGTSMKKRDEFNKMLRLCYKGKIDMIIVKSISRFARNTLDVIKITRKLRENNVDVYFEEQGIHSIDPASEFYITIYGSIAQSESETSAPMSNGAKHKVPSKAMCHSNANTSSATPKTQTAKLRSSPKKPRLSEKYMSNTYPAKACTESNAISKQKRYRRLPDVVYGGRKPFALSSRTRNTRAMPL